MPKRRQIWRRLCVAAVGRSPQRLRELVELNLVGVVLRRVGARVAHQRLESDEVATTFAEEAIREPMAQLVRGEGTNARPLAHTSDHPPQGLLARRLLRILAPARALVGGNPLLDLHSEHVVIELGLKLTEGLPELRDDVRIERKRLPVLPLPLRAHMATNEIEVCPPATENFRSTETGSLH